MGKLYVDEIHPKTTGGIITTTGLINVKEQLVMLCDGNNYTVSSGTYTPENVSAIQLGTTSFVDLTGSSISYTPPAGTTMVRYQFVFHFCYVDTFGIGHFKFLVDSDEVTKARVTMSANGNLQTLTTLDYFLPIGGFADTTTGRQASWTTAKTLKVQFREYNAANEAKAHGTHHFDGAGSAEFHMPKLAITALG